VMSVESFVQGLSEKLLDKFYLQGIKASSLDKAAIFGLFESSVKTLDAESGLKATLLTNLSGAFDLLWNSLLSGVPLSLTSTKRPAPEPVVSTPKKKKQKVAEKQPEDADLPNIFTARGVAFTQSSIEHEIVTEKNITPTQINTLSRMLVDQDLCPSSTVDLLFQGIQLLAKKEKAAIVVPPTTPGKRTPAKKGAKAPVAPLVSSLPKITQTVDTLQKLIQIYYPLLSSLNPSVSVDQVLSASQHGVETISEIIKLVEDAEKEKNIEKVEWEVILRKVSALVSLISSSDLSLENNKFRKSFLHLIALINFLFLRFDKNDEHTHHARSIGCRFTEKFGDRLCFVFFLMEELRSNGVNVATLPSKPKIQELLISLFNSSSTVNVQPFVTEATHPASKKPIVLFLQFLIVAKQSLVIFESQAVQKKMITSCVENFGTAEEIHLWIPSLYFPSREEESKPRFSAALHLLKNDNLTVEKLHVLLKKAETHRETPLEEDDGASL